MWTVRFLTAGFVSAIILFVLGVGLFNFNATGRLQRIMAEVARKVADEARSHGGVIPEDRILQLWMDARPSGFSLEIVPIVAVLDETGEIVQQYPPATVTIADRPFSEHLRANLDKILAPREHVAIVPMTAGQSTFVTAVHPIVGERITGYGLFALPQQPFFLMWMGIAGVPYRLGFMISFIVLSWLILYLLARRLIRPIEAAAKAAKRIVAGEYDIRLPNPPQEKEIQELVDSFREMAERLKHLEVLRNQWIAGVTHELKTPATSIGGLVQAVRDGVAQGEAAKECLDACLREVERLTRISDDLLAYGQLSGAGVLVDCQVVKLYGAVSDIVTRWRLSLDPSDQIDIKVTASDEAKESTARVDPIRLEQILINLFKNAKEAMEGSGRIEIRLDVTEAGLRVDVTDAGPGIPPDEQRDVFEPFFRGARKRAETRGLGLGLPLSRMMARSFGGELALSHTGPQGTTFTLTVPPGSQAAGADSQAVSSDSLTAAANEAVESDSTSV